MHLDSRIKALAGGVSLVALLAAMAAGGSASASPQAHSAACKKATNIEAIIDDSGSMDLTDPGQVPHDAARRISWHCSRTRARSSGGVEFGDTANVLFPPATIPGVIPAMDASFANVNADNGATDYNLAFATAKTANPNADGRIFLSDGEHNVGAYADGHASPPVKTDTRRLRDDRSHAPEQDRQRHRRQGVRSHRLESGACSRRRDHSGHELQAAAARRSRTVSPARVSRSAMPSRSRASPLTSWRRGLTRRPFSSSPASRRAAATRPPRAPSPMLPSRRGRRAARDSSRCT